MGANGKKEAAELVKRCEAVGWQVVRSGADHYKVDTRRGTFSIPTTPSEYRSMRNTLAEARKYGLEELEAKVAVTVESDRKKRIDDDRRANDAKLERIAQVNGATVAETKVTDVKQDVGFGLVNGVVVVAVAPATTKTPVMAKPAFLANAEELLLADGRVLYRCVKSGADGTPCHSVFNSSNSVRSHFRLHEPRDAAVPAKPERSTVSRTKTAPPTTTDEQNLLIKEVEELAAALYDIGGRLVDVRNTHIKLVEQIRALKPQVAEPDPVLVEKAAQFDQLSKTFKGLMR